MSTNRELLTQGELAALTEQLTGHVDNLSEHANAALDKAHGLNWEYASVDPYGGSNPGYYDGGGDLMTSPAPNNIVLRVSAGATHNVFYVPAILDDGSALPPQAGRTALAKSLSGLPPLDVALVTEYTQALEEEARIHNQVLFEHAKAITSSGSPKAHGQITFGVIDDLPGHSDARDTLGHSLGSHTLQIRIGNRIYRVPCTGRKQGPTQGARKLTDGEPEPDGQSTAPDGQAQPSLTAKFTVVGERPISFRWRAGSSAEALGNLFSSSQFAMQIDEDGYFTTGSSGHNEAVSISGKSCNWSFVAPAVSNNSSGVGRTSCSVTATPACPNSNTQYSDDLILCCDAKGVGDLAPVTSILVHWSAYDVTDSFC